MGGAHRKDEGRSSGRRAAIRAAVSALRAPAHFVHRRRPGAAPGIDTLPEIHTPPAPETVRIRVIDYGPERFREEDVADLDALFGAPRAADTPIRWIDVEALSPYVVHRFQTHFGFHTLAAEDVLHVPQRPKLEAHGDHLFLAAQMLTLRDGHLAREQVSFFLYEGTLITFGERPGDVWDPVRARIRADGSRLRAQDAGFLLHALLDALVDHCFPILEAYGDQLEDLEERLLARPDPAVLPRLHALKRELALLRRILWPTRDMVAALLRNESHRLTDVTLTYLRDVNDHATQVIDILETYRELAASLTDLYLSFTSNRLNEIMKVLTILSALFVPVTFLAGVYGMNFKDMPEMGWGWAYPTGFWIVCGAVTVGLLVFFWYRGWLGRRGGS